MEKIFVLFLIGVFLFSCSKPDDVSEGIPELKSGKMVERTIKFMKSIGTMEVVINDDACTDLGLQMFIQGAGNASHIGNYTVINTTCLDLDLNPISPIQGEITAANGDIIRTMVTKEPWMEDGVIHYYYELQPELCTGRFENATGFIIMYGIVDYNTMTWDLNGEGKIVY